MFNPLSGSAPEPSRLSQPIKINPTPPTTAQPSSPPPTTTEQENTAKAVTPNLPDARTLNDDVQAISKLQIQPEKVAKAEPVLKSLFRGLDEWGPVQGNSIALPDRASPGQESPEIGSIPGKGQEDPFLQLVQGFLKTLRNN